MILETALSVAMQSVTPQWLVHIDDESDWSSTVIKLKELVPNVIISQKKLGRVDSLSFLHNLVTTDYVGWLDDDDWLHPDCINECSKELPLIYTNHWRVNEGNVLMGKPEPYHYLQYSMKLYRAVGGLDFNYQTAIDLDLFLRLSIKVKPHFINKALYYYRIHDDRISIRHRNSQKANAQKIRHNHQLRTI